MLNVNGALNKIYIHIGPYVFVLYIDSFIQDIYIYYFIRNICFKLKGNDGTTDQKGTNPLDWVDPLRVYEYSKYDTFAYIWWLIYSAGMCRWMRIYMEQELAHYVIQ